MKDSSKKTKNGISFFYRAPCQKKWTHFERYISIFTSYLKCLMTSFFTKTHQFSSEVIHWHLKNSVPFLRSESLQLYCTQIMRYPTVIVQTASRFHNYESQHSAAEICCSVLCCTFVSPAPCSPSVNNWDYNAGNLIIFLVLWSCFKMNLESFNSWTVSYQWFTFLEIQWKIVNCRWQNVGQSESDIICLCNYFSSLYVIKYKTRHF